VPRTGHIAEIRAAIGSRLLLMPAVSNAVFDAEDRLLLLRHTEWDGGWGTPGGAVEPDETPVEAARRELAEETGLRLEPQAIVAVLGGPDHVVRYANGDETAYVTTIFASRWDGAAVVPDGREVDDARWVDAAGWHGLSMHGSMRSIVHTIFAWLAEVRSDGDRHAPARFDPLPRV
jgi:8-oxo-dGTP pyrophosphatase MutT (NUDIX family)